MDPSISTSPRSSSSPSGTASPSFSRTPTPLTGKKRPREESGLGATTDLQHQVTLQAEIGTNSQNSAMNNGNYLPSSSENRPKITSTSSSSGEQPRQSQQPETSTSATTKSTENNLPEKEKRGASADDLLVPLAGFDWTGFESQCKADQQGVDSEEAALLEEFHSWVWLYELWVTCRSQSQGLRLNREMATITKWMQLEEAKVEQTRVQHTEVAQQISAALGLSGMLSPHPGK
ncbi:hypothetical protein K440DRAFT_617107 [Wilcoxina mikolae CBS 423.85]|nr:hypothetical protein K440DRAFT_617107 [Wilcoxina mikolae CBS 423.85]